MDEDDATLVLGPRCGWTAVKARLGGANASSPSRALVDETKRRMARDDLGLRYDRIIRWDLVVCDLGLVNAGPSRSKEREGRETTSESWRLLSSLMGSRRRQRPMIVVAAHERQMLFPTACSNDSNQMEKRKLSFRIRR